MIAKVKSGKSMKGALNYNEHKVTEGIARCIGANLFIKEVDQLTFFEKLHAFTDLNERNMRTKTNTLHVSLNFDPSEKPDTITLNQIASSYMEQIGFSEQPYLVYQHFDAAHPHIHILSTLIKPDGKRIPIHYLGKNQSEKARQKIENEFNLIKASGKKNEQQLTPATLTKITYGKHTIKKSISDIVSNVTRQYHFTSLSELNAVLRLYNVTSDRGHEQTMMFRNGGLHYSLSDADGLKIGIPIKASALPGKPTLKYLEKQFEANSIKRAPFKDPLKRIIETCLSNHSIHTPTEFRNSMNAQGVHVIYRVNDHGLVYGITFVDTKRKTVFNGSTLGKAFGASAILERLSANGQQISQKLNPPAQEKVATTASHHYENSMPSNQTNSGRLTELIGHTMLTTDVGHVSPDYAMRLRKRRRRKKK
jgi:hypothetical protein